MVEFLKVYRVLDGPTSEWADPSSVVVEGQHLGFWALGAWRHGLVIGTGPRRILVRYRCNTGSRFKRYLPVTGRRLTVQAVEAIGRSLEKFSLTLRAVAANLDSNAN